MRVKCRNCGFIWNYKGERQMATCPNCIMKTPANDLDDTDE